MTQKSVFTWHAFIYQCVSVASRLRAPSFSPKCCTVEELHLCTRRSPTWTLIVGVLVHVAGSDCKYKKTWLLFPLSSFLEQPHRQFFKKLYRLLPCLCPNSDTRLRLRGLLKCVIKPVIIVKISTEEEAAGSYVYSGWINSVSFMAISHILHIVDTLCLYRLESKQPAR